jgi:hypothetical protein
MTRTKKFFYTSRWFIMAAFFIFLSINSADKGMMALTIFSAFMSGGYSVLWLTGYVIPHGENT